MGLSLLGVDERNSDSYVFRDVFFFRINFDFFFRFSSFPVLNGMQTPLSKSKDIKVLKNVIDLNFGIMEFNFQIAQKNKKFAY